MAVLGRHHDVRVRKELDQDADDAVAPRVPRPRLLAVARDERLGEGAVVGVEVPVGDVKERRVGWGHRWRRGGWWKYSVGRKVGSALEGTWFIPGGTRRWSFFCLHCLSFVLDCLFCRLAKLCDYPDALKTNTRYQSLEDTHSLEEDASIEACARLCTHVASSAYRWYKF